MTVGDDFLNSAGSVVVSGNNLYVVNVSLSVNTSLEAVIDQFVRLVLIRSRCSVSILMIPLRSV